MSTYQKITIVGNCGKDPEIRYLPDGKAVANFSIATSERWKDKGTGEVMEKTEWHRCTAFDRLAEIIGEYVKKGSKVLVEGKLKTRKWSDQAGVERYTTEVNCTEMKMLSAREDQGNGGAPRQQAQQRPGASPAARQAPAPRPSSGFDDMDDDSIPF